MAGASTLKSDCLPIPAGITGSHIALHRRVARPPDELASPKVLVGVIDHFHPVATSAQGLNG